MPPLYPDFVTMILPIHVQRNLRIADAACALGAGVAPPASGRVWRSGPRGAGGRPGWGGAPSLPWWALALFLVVVGGPAWAADSPGLFLREFRVQGSTALPPEVVERAVYPYLGPGRTAEDAEMARAALERAYQEHGYQTVSVSLPPQSVKRGVVILQVTERPVGRLRVRGSKYHDPEVILADAPSLKEGSLPDFREVLRDVVALNQWPGRRVVPELVPGAEGEVVDVDLRVEDELPLHGSLELNNRYSTGTSELRLNASLRYDNLWQRGHGIGFAAQTSPLDWSEVLVYSGFYTARFRAWPDWSLQVNASRQDTALSTLGNSAVVGQNHSYGLRAVYVWPQVQGVYRSLGIGLDHKRTRQEIDFGGQTTVTPLTYHPLQITYSSLHFSERSQSEFYGTLTLHGRRFGSSAERWDDSRFLADGSFLSFRADFSHTREIGGGLNAFGRVQGQLASGPLISQQQFSAGGFDTVRGYLEGEGIGDQAVGATLELRTPSWRFRGGEPSLSAHLFFDLAALWLRSPLPGQPRQSDLASFGVGARYRLASFLHGTFDLGFPLVDLGQTEAWTPRITFTLRGDL